MISFRFKSQVKKVKIKTKTQGKLAGVITVPTAGKVELATVWSFSKTLNTLFAFLNISVCFYNKRLYMRLLSVLLYDAFQHFSKK